MGWQPLFIEIDECPSLRCFPNFRLLTALILAGVLTPVVLHGLTTIFPVFSIASGPTRASLALRFIGLERLFASHTHRIPNLSLRMKAHHVDPPNLANAPRLVSLIQDGKLLLSMDDAIALTLENNLDLAIARYNLNIAETDILRTEGGASTLGVNTGLVQNTPGGSSGGLGGTVGSGSGGTNPGSAGIATGTNGLVSSTLGIGSAITSFDPILSGTLQMDRAHCPFHQCAERGFRLEHQHRNRRL